MSKIINKLLSFLRVILILGAFAFTLYILLYMYYNLGKEPLGSEFLDFASNLLPFMILLIFCVVNFVGRYKEVSENTFYNITSVLVLGVIVFMAYRAVFDQNMVLWHKTDYHINFEYFADQLFQIKAMLYALSGINLLLIIESILGKDKTKKIKEEK